MSNQRPTPRTFSISETPTRPAKSETDRDGWFKLVRPI